MTIPELYDIYLAHPTVQTDSRKALHGHLFFALKGDNFDGNQFAAQALANGAAYAVVDDAAVAINNQYILVEDALAILQQLANYHRLQLAADVIAVTGSNGKTTTKELLHAVLAAKYVTYATEGNLNNHIGVPLTLLKVKADAEKVIVEMGANHIGEIAGYCAVANPSFGLITNCGKAHLEGFGSIDGVRKAKGELYDHIRKFKGTVFRNADLDYLAEMAHDIAEQVAYGTDGQAQLVGKSLEGNTLLDVAILTAGMETTIHTQLVGSYNLPNVLAAVAVGRYFGMDIDTMKAAIEAYVPGNSRSQLLKKGSNTIILDAYNANPTSMKLALENMASLQADNKWLLLGAMKEMGQESLAEHQALVDLAVALGFKNVLLTGSEFYDTEHPYPVFATSAQTRDYIAAHKPGNASILVKGSRGSKMEVVLEAF
ncbi:MAG: UDP-N-acetylmuramoyl-tripeptide--D-alanyl-D-alanine ligase [Edaphocola sp.]